jgi:hypothetical protein
MISLRFDISYETSRSVIICMRLDREIEKIRSTSSTPSTRLGEYDPKRGATGTRRRTRPTA